MKTITNNETNKIPYQLQRDGFGFVKLPPRSKKPFETDWQNKHHTCSDIQAHINHGGNYGVLGGVGDLIIIDADTPEISALTQTTLPDTFTVTTPGKGRHYYFICKDIKKKIVLKKGETHFGEIISLGSQVVGAGSIHPDTGTEYAVSNDVEIATVSQEQVYSELREYISLDLPQGETEDISILDVLSRANITTRRIGGQLVCGHPIHGSTNNNNFVVHPDKNVWRCFRCNTGGGPLSLIAVLEKIIDCREALPGGLKGDKFLETCRIAREKYGFNIKKESEKSLHIRIASEILRDHRLFYCTGNFYEYGDGYYKNISNEKVQKWIKDLVGDRFRQCLSSEVIFSLQTEAHIDQNQLNTGKYLNLRNGLFDIETEKLLPHSPETYSTIQLGVNYNPGANCKKWLMTVYEIFDKDESKIETLQEFFGLCLTQDTRYEKALFMLGEGRNGKSTILYVLENLIGEANRTAIPLEKLSNSHYLANLHAKLVNISVETNAKSEVYDSTFKQLVSGDSVTADRKFGQEFTFRPYCKLIYALNNMPRVNDKTVAFYRRLLILKFERQFNDDVANKNLKFELMEELDGIFLWCLEGLRNLKARGYFKIDSKMQIEIEDYRRENNNVLLFVEEKCVVDSLAEVSKQDLYTAFSDWCKLSGHKPLSMKRFGMDLIKQYREIKDARDNFGDRVWGGICLQGRTEV